VSPLSEAIGLPAYRQLVGIWLDKSWKHIREELGHRFKYSKLEVLFSDGGSGIVANLLDPGMRPQRCM
jgi:hypothetical protein